MRAGIVCAGVSCLDLLLYGTEPLATRESVSLVRETHYRPGGATSNTGRALALLGMPVEYMTVIGEDTNGDLLLDLWRRDGIDTRYVVRTPSAGTALSTVPVYADGKRGVYFCPGTNALMSIDNLFGPDRTHLEVLRERQAFHLGYPSLLPLLQGPRLAETLSLVRDRGVLVSLDTTPVADDADSWAMLAPAMPLTHLFTPNIQEAAQVAGFFPTLMERAREAELDIEAIVTPEELVSIGERLMAMGVPVVVITLGPNGAFACTGPEAALREVPLLTADLSGWASQRLFIPACQIDGPLNSAGAGDTFTAALLTGICHSLSSIAQAVRFAHAVAALHVDRSRGMYRFEQVMDNLPAMQARLPDNPLLPAGGDVVPL